MREKPKKILKAMRNKPPTSAQSINDPSLLQRKKPHTLPPLEKRNLGDFKGHVIPSRIIGSPPPQMLGASLDRPAWRRYSTETVEEVLEESMDQSQPAIRISHCPDDLPSRRPSDILLERNGSAVSVASLAPPRVPSHRVDEMDVLKEWVIPEDSELDAHSRRHKPLHIANRYAPLEPIKRKGK